MKKRIISLLGILVMLMTVFNSPSFSSIQARAEEEVVTMHFSKEEVGKERLRIIQSDETLIVGTSTIVGFNSDTVFNTIDRMTIQSDYYSYAWWDLFHLSPALKSYQDVISSSDLRRPIVPFEDNLVALTGLPLVGFVSDLIAYQVGKTEFLMDYEEQQNSLTVSESSLNDYDYYLIIPVPNTIETIMVSVAGLTVDGYVDDGLDENGIPYTEDGLSYIVVNPFTIKSIYFTESTIIKKITISGLVSNDEVNFIVANYDHVEDKWQEPSITHSFTANGEFSVYGLVAARQLGLFVYDGVANYSIKLYYESEGFVVYTNVVGSDGTIMPSFEEPANLPWWGEYLAMLQGIVRIVLLVLGIALFFIIVNGMIKFLTNVNRFSSSVKEKNGYKKSYKGRK